MQYLQVNGDRIVGFSDWNGKGTRPENVRNAPDGITSEWIGKSYDAAISAASQSKDGKNISAKDAPDGLRAEELKQAEGGLHHSGEVFNSPDTHTIAAEHPLDPVLGSQMRTPQPELHVAIVPASQPKTDAQAAKDAGEPIPETAPDRAKARVAAQEAQASHVRPPTSQPAPTDDDVRRNQPRRTAPA